MVNDMIWICLGLFVYLIVLIIVFIGGNKDNEGCVRCRDCKYHAADGICELMVDDEFGWDTITLDNWWCGLGERKGG